MSAIDWPTIMTALQTWVKDSSGLSDTAVFWTYGKVARPPAPFITLAFSEIRQVAHDYITKAPNFLSFPAQGVTVDVPGNRLIAPGHTFVTGDGPVNLATTGTEPAPVAVGGSYWIVVLDSGHVRLASTFRNAMAASPVPVVFTTAGAGTLSIVATPKTTRAGLEVKRTSQGIREVTLEMQCFAPEGSTFLAVATLTDVLASLSLHVQDLNQAGIGVSDLGVAYLGGGVRLIEGHRGSILEPRSIVELTIYLTTAVSDFTTYIESVNLAAKPAAVDGTALPEFDFTIPKGD